MRKLIVGLLAAILIGCGSTPVRVNPVSEDIILNQQKMLAEMVNVYPEFYLVKCQWMMPYSGGDLLVFRQTHKENRDKYLDCYLRHNGLVDLIKERQ